MRVRRSPAHVTSLPLCPTAVYGGGEQLGTVADCSGGQCPTGVGRRRGAAGSAGGGASHQGLALPRRWCYGGGGHRCGQIFLRQEEASVTSNVSAHPPFTSLTICGVAQCCHRQLEGPPGPVLRSPSCRGPFRDLAQGSMWPLWPEPRFAA